MLGEKGISFIFIPVGGGRWGPQQPGEKCSCCPLSLSLSSKLQVILPNCSLEYSLSNPAATWAVYCFAAKCFSSINLVGVFVTTEWA